MSTTELYLEPDIIRELVKRTLVDDEMTTWGIDDNKYGIGPYVSFYMYHEEDEKLIIAEKIISIYEEFENLIDEPFNKVFKSSTESWLGPNDKRLPKDLKQVAKENFEDDLSFYIGATDRVTDEASPRWAIHGKVTKYPTRTYSVIKMNFTYLWYSQNKKHWIDFINRCVGLLQPEHCYSGFEISSGPLGIMGNYEAEAMERVCVDYFYGLDIDHQLKMSRHSHDEDDYLDITRLGAGIRTPSWCFMLSPFWLNKLGKTENEVRAELDDPRITISAFPYSGNSVNSGGRLALFRYPEDATGVSQNQENRPASGSSKRRK